VRFSIIDHLGARPHTHARMAVQLLFPTLVYQARLPGWRRLNAPLLRECRQLRADAAAGRRRSQRSDPGGYTSYNSAHRMHRRSPTFATLARELDRHVAKLARALQLDLTARPLGMTDCWVNVMGRGAVHGLHLHPLSTISGTYYVAVPQGAPGLKFEDPRLERFMASPPRGGAAGRGQRPWVTLRARAGGLVLFESWRRHEVAPHPLAAARVSSSCTSSCLCPG